MVQKVVDEIIAAGGEAVANYDSVLDGEKIVQAALDNFGRVDILTNNAGILRDKSFYKMTEEDWDLVYNVHVKGAFKLSQWSGSHAGHVCQPVARLTHLPYAKSPRHR